MSGNKQQPAVPQCQEPNQFLFYFFRLRKNDEQNVGTEETGKEQKGYDNKELLTLLLFLAQVCQTVVMSVQNYKNSKNLDLCFHNFRCLRPSLGLDAFNHVLVSCAYAVCGVVVFVVAYINKSKKAIDNHMAMGISLFIYGISFMAYKACPTIEGLEFSKSNFTLYQ